MIEWRDGTVYDPPNSQDLKIIILVEFHYEHYALKLQNDSPNIKNTMCAFVDFEATFEHLVFVSW